MGILAYTEGNIMKYIITRALAFGIAGLANIAVASTVWINEIHYDNASTDTGEFVEIAGTAGTDLSGWTVALYNGANGALYDTINLSGVIDSDGALAFFQAGIQNGAPDGLALVDDLGGLVQFLSYEGAFTAIGGPADGLASTDIGVSESSTTPVGQSLQLTGTGSAYSDFTWAGPATATPGAPNLNQTLDVGGVVPVPAAVWLFGSGLLGLIGVAGRREAA